MSLYIPKMSDTPAITIPGLADNFTLLAGSRIVEQGSNENGEYWRWENGLQVCYFFLAFAYDLPEPLGEGETMEMNFLFPAEFAQIPIAVGGGKLTSSNGATRRGWITCDSPNRQLVNLILYNADARNVYQYRRGGYMAVGRWK